MDGEGGVKEIADSQGKLAGHLEVTAIVQKATLTTSSTLPVTLKRTVDTTVIVRDNQTIVIGGLIDDTTTDSETKVPVLGLVE